MVEIQKPMGFSANLKLAAIFEVTVTVTDTEKTEITTISSNTIRYPYKCMYFFQFQLWRNQKLSCCTSTCVI